jgi:hypothetical protein
VEFESHESVLLAVAMSGQQISGKYLTTLGLFLKLGNYIVLR